MSAFKEVTKEAFKQIYFRLGGGRHSGWTAEYWQQFFEDDVKPGWQFMVEEPKTPGHDQMWIVTDVENRQYRLFFMTEQATDDFFDSGGT
jgi:hypothetical protein